MGCMPFPYGQRHNRGLYRGKSDPWVQTLVQQSALCGSTADAARIVNVECTVVAKRICSSCRLSTKILCKLLCRRQLDCGHIYTGNALIR